MIIVQVMGGLGNQMFQYAFGRSLASRRRVELYLDVRWFEQNRTRRFRLDSYPIAASIASAREIETLTRGGWRGLSQRIRSGLPPRSWHRMPRTIMERDLRYAAIHEMTMADYIHYTGYWQSEMYFQHIADELRETFQPPHPRSDGYRQWSERIQGTSSVSVHVRRGDYLHVEEHGRVHGLCDRTYFNAAISFITAQVPNARYFVFSDDPAWCHEHFRDVADAMIVDFAGAHRDLEQLDLMRLCRHHIISNSTYGWWGAWLGSREDAIVIAPQRWFADASLDDRDIIPERWVRM